MSGIEVSSSTILTDMTIHGHDETMKRAMVSELKSHLSAYLAEVRQGRSIVVCDRATPLARLGPHEPDRAGTLDDDQVGAFHRALTRVERVLETIRLTRLVLGRAALPMATPVKTLDALHLASALLWRERRNPDLVFATHDPQQARAARTLGFDCVGVS